MRARRLAFLIGLLLVPAVVRAQPLAEQIDAVLKGAATPRRGVWGIHVLDLSSGKAVYEREQDRFFVPASTAKLFSTALALQHLGPDYRFRTVVTAATRPAADGTLRGDLRLVGGGDPSLSGRVFPYQPEAPAGNPLSAIEELAGAVVQLGVKRIDGDILGDDTAFYWDPYPEGRAQEDSLWEYGAPVSALAVNDNRIGLVVRPGRRVGDPARIEFSPPLDYFNVQNRLTTGADTRSNVQVAREPGSRRLRLWGTIPLKGPPEVRSLAVDDPALFAAVALHDALVRRGVAIAGRPQAVHLYRGLSEAAPAAFPAGKEVVLAERWSPPLTDLLTVVNKESVNLHAELLLAEVGRAKSGTGGRQEGLKEMEAFLKEAGIPEGEVRLVDASGLSMLDLVTPRALTSLLTFMQRSPHREAFLGSLPVAGEEGTLRQRFRGQVEARRLRAKTGTLSRVLAISGYAGTSSGRTLAFALVVNSFAAPVSEVRLIVDKICMLMVQ